MSGGSYSMHSRLSDVWKAIEWWDSSDNSENDVKEALKKYRGEVKEA